MRPGDMHDTRFPALNDDAELDRELDAAAFLVACVVITFAAAVLAVVGKLAGLI